MSKTDRPDQTLLSPAGSRKAEQGLATRDYAIDSGFQQSSGGASESMCASIVTKANKTKLAKNFYWNIFLLPVGFEDAYRDAITLLRGMRREEQLRGAREDPQQ